MRPSNNNKGGGGSKSTLGEIQRLEKEREARRRAMDAKKQQRAEAERRNQEAGLGAADVDFQRMIQQFRDKVSDDEVTMRAALV